MDVEDDAIKGEIYAEFLKFCEPAGAPAPWGRFSTGSDFFRPPADESAVHETLRTKYSGRTLRRSCVMIMGPHKRLVLNPRLSVRPNFVIPLLITTSGKPFDLLTSEGTVSGRLPVHEAARDHLMGEGDKRHGLVLTTFDIHDALVLRAVGAPAVVLVKPLLAQAMQETDLLMQSRLFALVEANRMSSPKIAPVGQSHEP